MTANPNPVRALEEYGNPWPPTASSTVASKGSGVEANPAAPKPLEPEALVGLAGEFVEAVGPYSEADPVALLAHLLVATGCLIGPWVHTSAADAVHTARLFAVVVGNTGHGRKGSAAAPVRRLMAEVDPTFPSRVVEGLSSGEGLIYQVRDPITGFAKSKRGPREPLIVDQGEADKRLWVLESEFAGPLKLAQAERNILTQVVRRAWDDGDLRTLTKNSPTRATGAHISIVGHVTRDEVRRHLTATDQASGFANRFLWFAVHRVRLLPDGESVPQGVLGTLVSELARVRDWAETSRHLTRDPDASDLWRHVYGPLTTDRPGLLGAATNRAEAQALRLSLLYAALDRSPAIRVEHILAALAVWEFAEASAAHILGDALGDALADEILAALRRSSLSRTEINDLLSRHAPKDRIERALAVLRDAGRAACVRDAATGGRPREIWSALR